MCVFMRDLSNCVKVKIRYPGLREWSGLQINYSRWFFGGCENSFVRACGSGRHVSNHSCCGRSLGHVADDWLSVKA